jgi:hypothetical protein
VQMLKRLNIAKGSLEGDTQFKRRLVFSVHPLLLVAFVPARLNSIVLVHNGLQVKC